MRYVCSVYVCACVCKGAKPEPVVIKWVAGTKATLQWAMLCLLSNILLQLDDSSRCFGYSFLYQKDQT